MTSLVMRYTVVVVHPDSGAPVALLAGEEVPSWASSLVQGDDLVKAGGVAQEPDLRISPDSGGGPVTDPSDPTFDEAAAKSRWDAEKVGALRAEISRRNGDRDPEGGSYITPEEPGNKPELVAALVADDKAAAGA